MAASSKKTWQEIAIGAQEHRDATIAQLDPPLPDLPSELPSNVMSFAKEFLTLDEVTITETPPEELVAQLASQELTATAVTKAFLRRAGLAQKLTNCITELLTDRAIERAKFLDDYIAEHGKPIGPLHGLAISVKEHIPMAGLDLNAGFISWVGQKAPENAFILQILWKAGCVFYVRTTQPQTLMHLETSNNIYGETVNPFNRSLTAGGSSGGEGALVGFRGSCLGIGTDIGGSIRSPAANNGVYGLRPTSYRLPNAGFAATMLGQEQIVPVVGPLSTSLEGIKLFMKTLIAAKPWLVTPDMLPFEWRDSQEWLRKDDAGNRKLKVGVIWDDGIVKPHPPVIRALSEVVEKLRGHPGVEVVDWKPYKHDLAWEIIASLYFCDAGIQEKKAIEDSGEPWRPLSEFIIKDNPYVRDLSVSEVWDWTMKREGYRVDYAKLWNGTATQFEDDYPVDPVDVILCPVGPGAAPPLNCARYWGYTAQWNLLDYPALVFPVTQVKPDIDVVDESYQPRNEKDRYNYKLYEPEKYRDAPVSLQLVARRYEDEKVIQALEFITECTGLPFFKPV